MLTLVALSVSLALACAGPGFTAGSGGRPEPIGRTAPSTVGSAAPTPTLPELRVAGPRPLRDRVLFGAYVNDLPSGRSELPALERLVGARLEVASTFVPWNHVFGDRDDGWLSAGGDRRIVTSWEPFGVRYRAVIDGKCDGLLQRIAERMARYPYDIWVRPWPEMNASWSTWQPTPEGDRINGGTPAEFIDAWHHVVDYMRARGVRNLRFVFNPDATDTAADTPVTSIWPGATYVDAIGLDGYNWGDDPAEGRHWTSFEDIFAPMYRTVTALHPTAPVWITETSSKDPAVADGAPTDPGHRRSDWIRALMESTAFPRLELVAWFNVAKERDWRLESSADSLAAIRDELQKRNRPVARG